MIISPNKYRIGKWNQKGEPDTPSPSSKSIHTFSDSQPTTRARVSPRPQQRRSGPGGLPQLKSHLEQERIDQLSQTRIRRSTHDVYERQNTPTEGDRERQRDRVALANQPGCRQSRATKATGSVTLIGINANIVIKTTQIDPM